jgi:hypothetical protein
VNDQLRAQVGSSPGKGTLISVGEELGGPGCSGTLRRKEKSILTTSRVLAFIEAKVSYYPIMFIKVIN